MKKLYFLILATFAVAGLSAQCTINTALLDTVSGNGMYPDAAHLPAIVVDSAYDQTVQGKIETSQSMTIDGFTGTITVDSVRLDSLNGLPTGITWIKNPNVLPGGGYGCVEFVGTTTDTPGTYPIAAVGMIWAHLSFPPLVNEDTSSYGSLNQMTPFRNFYLVVDSAPQPLTAVATARNLCYGVTTGTATVTATGGQTNASYSYLWNTGSTAYTITNIGAGTYTVTVTSGTDTVITSVTIATEPLALGATVSADSSTTGNNGSATIDVTGGLPPYTYRWTPGGATTDSIDSLAPGTYHVTVRDSFGCTYRDSVVVPGVTSGISPLASQAPKITLFPNPANNLINVFVESPGAINAKLEALDMTGRVVYSAPASIADRYSCVINLSDFSSGIYVLQLSSEAQSVHQRFVVTH